MTMRNFFAILRARSWLALTMFGTVVFGVALVTALMPHQYTSSSQILVDARQTNVTTGQGLDSGFVSNYLATQVDIVKSRPVALKVAEALATSGGVGNGDPKFTPGPVRAEESDRYEATAELLLRGLKVEPLRESSLLQIAYTDKDPRRAAWLANAFAQAYVDTSARVRVAPAKAARASFEAERAQLRKDLDEAQRKLAAYQRANNITSTDERTDVETARLNELSTQYTALQGQAAESARRAQSAAGGAVDSADVLQNQLVQQLKAELARVEARIQERSAVLGSQHPELLRMQQEAESLRARIATEARAINSSLSRSAEVNRGRLEDVSRALAEQRTRVLSMRQVRTELQALQRDVDSAQRAYDQVNERFSQTNLESRVQQNNIMVIAPAAVPRLPSSPKVLLNMFAAVVVGAALAVLAVILREMLRPKVRTVEDVMFVLEAPVLAELSRVKKSAMRRRLVGPRGRGGREPGWRGTAPGAVS